MAYTPRHLDLWRRPSNYIGADWSGWFPVYGIHRDSCIRSQSNYCCIKQELEALQTETEIDGELTETVQEAHDGHFLVGWMDTLLVHASNEAALRKADSLLDRLEQYPLLDEDDVSEREWNAAADCWAAMSVRDRCEAMIRELGYWLDQGVVSLFSARRAELPEDPQGCLLDYLTSP